MATDFDGTLTPIVDKPGSASLTGEAVEVLYRLSEKPGCTLMIASGRSLADLRSRVPVPAILAGNHGLEVEGPGLSFRHPDAVASSAKLAEVCGSIRAMASRWSGALVEFKGLTATVHYRHVPDGERRELTRAVRRFVGVYGREFGLRAGKRALEIYPRVGWDKGSAVNWVRSQLGPGVVLCIGDDRTDEAMFRGCCGAVTIAVGSPRESAAEFLVGDSSEVLSVLSLVSAAPMVSS